MKFSYYREIQNYELISTLILKVSQMASQVFSNGGYRSVSYCILTHLFSTGDDWTNPFQLFAAHYNRIYDLFLLPRVLEYFVAKFVGPWVSMMR